MQLPPLQPERGVLKNVWREFNKLRDYVASLRPLPGANVHIKHTCQGILLSATPPTKRTEGTIVQLFRVQTINAESLTCRTWDGVTQGTTDIEVLKPDTLRPSFYGSGETIPAIGSEPAYAVTYAAGSGQQRTASYSGESETQAITPPYQANSEIVAAKLSYTVPGEGEAEDTEYDWIDLNVAARAWAAYEECPE